jgi:hypothetical protein
LSVPDFEASISPKPGRTLIVGSHIWANKEDRRKHYPDVVGVDMQAGPGVDRVCDLEIGPDIDGAVLDAKQESLGTFAHIECMSVLEHCRRPWLMAANIERMLIPGGTLFVTVPFIWRVHGYPDDYWRFTISGVKVLFPGIQWEKAAYSGRKLTKPEDIPSIRSDDDWPHFSRTEVCMFGEKIA